MFRRLDDALSPAPMVALSVDGVRIEARAGDLLAAALLASGNGVCRATPVSGAPRAP
jgi:hypothetical protein